MPDALPHIFLQGLTVHSLIGVYPEERNGPQPLLIDVEVGLPSLAAFRSDQDPDERLLPQQGGPAPGMVALLAKNEIQTTALLLSQQFGSEADLQLDAGLRVPLPEALQHLRQPGAGEVLRGPDAQAPPQGHPSQPGTGLTLQIEDISAIDMLEFLAAK